MNTELPILFRIQRFAEPARFCGGAVRRARDDKKAERLAGEGGELQASEIRQTRAFFAHNDNRRHCAGSQRRFRRPEDICGERTGRMEQIVWVAKARHRFRVYCRNPARRPAEHDLAFARH